MSKKINNKSLDDYQKIIKELANARGFDEESVSQKFMLLVEEIGEFAKAARNISGIKKDINSLEKNLNHEAADVFFVLVDLCNNLGVNLEKAFESKEKINIKEY